jgi:hypothetical protein
MRTLIADLGSAEALHCDLIPSNMFALTGDSLWTTLSVRLADPFFHDTVLSGYFAHHFDIILVSDVRRERPVRYNLLYDNIQVLRSRLPLRLLQALAADLRHGYRLTQSPELASRLLKGR